MCVQETFRCTYPKWSAQEHTTKSEGSQGQEASCLVHSQEQGRDGTLHSTPKCCSEDVRRKKKKNKKTVVQCLKHKWKLNLSCSYLLTHNRLPCAWALIPGLSPMCCKNRQLTDHFPWQKEIAEGHARASPWSFPAAVREVTELGNLLVFRSLPGAEYWWAAHGAWWQALPAGGIPSCRIKPQKWVLLAFPWPVSINFVEATCTYTDSFEIRIRPRFGGRHFPPQVANTVALDRQRLRPTFHRHRTGCKAAENLNLKV